MLATVGVVIGYIFFFAIMAAALAVIIVGLPGAWIILIEALVFALVTDFDKGIGWYDLLALLALAGTGELLEFLITARGAQKEGGSWKSMLAAIVGGIVGALVVNGFIPVIGAVLGAFLGAYAGAYLQTYLEHRDKERARQIALGAFKGRIGGALSKISVGVAMVAIIVWRIFF